VSEESKTTVISRTAVWSARHRWWVLGAAVLLILLAGYVGMSVETVSREDDGGEGESARADELLDSAFGAEGRPTKQDDASGAEGQPAEQLVVASESHTVDDPEFRAVVDDVVRRLRALRAVEEVTTFYETSDPALVSEDRHVMRLPVHAFPVGEVLDTVEDAAAEAEGFTLSIAGQETLEYEDERILDEDFAMVLFVSLGAGLVILLLAFRSLIAAIIPLATALGAIFVTLAVAAVISHTYALAELYAEMVLLMGLAVGIDYSLFIVARFRRERAVGRERYEAIEIASRTTGRAVFYAGMTVVLSIAGLMLTDNSIFISLSLGAIIVVAVAVVASLTLIPASLAIIGDGVNRLRIPLPVKSGAEDGGAWAWVTGRVLKRPGVFATIAATGMVALALPVTSLNLGFSLGSAGYSDAVRSKAGLELLEEHFAAGLTEPAGIVIVGSGPEVDAAVQDLYGLLDADPAFRGPYETLVSEEGSVTLVRAPIVYDLDDSRSEDGVRRLRNEILPQAFEGSGLDVYVTGETAGSMDFTSHMYARAPYVLGFVLGLAFLLMLVMFRSLIIPIKAVVLNLLSVAAAYGVLVLVFQEGVGQGLLGFEATGRIAPWLPLFLFAILFGLSMDYHMLLLNRIKEAYDEGLSNEESVAIGIKATAGTITSAAAIMVAVFGSFALARDLELKQFGLGLGVAVLLDATVIRVVLLPATMKLLGDRNWYLPNWLSWLPGVSPRQAGEATSLGLASE
jgi:uncharacterized membrane protein YdfJ with MMPL/SSD domain